MSQAGANTASGFQVEDHWRSIDLLSDVHLHPFAPRTFDAWRLHLLQTSADAVLILGDLFEVWVGDDSRDSGFERECADVLAQASKRCVVGFMAGNRDFLVGTDMLAECGVRRLADPTLLSAWGRRYLLSHGDALCLADVDYQRFRAQVRSQAWQSGFLAQPLIERRRLARAMRDASAEHQAARPAAEAWADVDELAACDWLKAAKSETLIHGHTHRPGVVSLPGGRKRLVLSDWDLDVEPNRASVLRLCRQGFEVLDLGDATAA
jgi:UDP-2,3-diacylglucosamine hydrolase